MDEMEQKKKKPKKITLVNLSWHDMLIILVIRSSQPDKSNQTRDPNHEIIII